MLQQVPYKLPTLDLAAGKDTLRYDGTVKLHGVHRQIVQQSSGTMTVASKKGPLNLPALDETGFSEFYTTGKFLPLLHLIRYRRKHPGSVIIDGIWCGRLASDAGCALALCDPFFCIIDIRVGDAWIPLHEFKDVSNRPEHIYNIYDFPVCHVQAPVADVMTVNEQVSNFTSDTCEQCPVAKVLGCDGKGGGVVWRCQDLLDHEAWFQTRCQATFSLSTEKQGSTGTRAAPKVTKATST